MYFFLTYKQHNFIFLFPPIYKESYLDDLIIARFHTVL